MAKKVAVKEVDMTISKLPYEIFSKSAIKSIKLIEEKECLYKVIGKRTFTENNVIKFFIEVEVKLKDKIARRIIELTAEEFLSVEKKLGFKLLIMNINDSVEVYIQPTSVHDDFDLVDRTDLTRGNLEYSYHNLHEDNGSLSLYLGTTNQGLKLFSVTDTGLTTEISPRKLMSLIKIPSNGKYNYHKLHIEGKELMCDITRR